MSKADTIIFQRVLRVRFAPPKRAMIVRVLVSLVILLLLLSVSGFFVRQAQLLDRQFIFLPERKLEGNPGDAGMVFEDVLFSTSDGVTLHGWFVPGGGTITFLWFHGNAGNISHRVDHIKLIHQQLEVSIFIFDYRGYGRSEGKPSEKGTYLDAEAALEYLRSRPDADPKDKLVLFGQSLGSGVAVETASRHKVGGLILESPFTSIRGMARKAYPYLPSGLLVHLVEARYDSFSKIQNIDSPLLVVHGDRDELVPIEMGQELFGAADEPKVLYTVAGARHNDIYLVGGDGYVEALRRFMRQYVLEPGLAG
ncbi:MAG: alpha/beta hydrolase [Dehalococcoidia bacterium]